MAEPAAVSALAGHLAVGRCGRADGAPGLTLEEVAVGAMTQLLGVADGDALAAALSAHGLDAAPTRLRCSQGADLRLLWTGPGQYLAVSHGHAGEALAALLGESVAGLGGVAVDVSHARTVLRLGGPACAEVLAKGCALDVEAMASGACAPTLLGHFNVIVHREGPQAFVVYVPRSFAVACFEWLRRAGWEFGVEVS